MRDLIPSEIRTPLPALCIATGAHWRKILDYADADPTPEYGPG